MHKINSNEELVEFLKKTRKLRRISQEELANFSGLHRKAISKIELGNSDIKISTLLNIAALLGIKIYVDVDSEVST